MHLLREDLRGEGVRMLLAAVVLAAGVLAGFDWNPLLTAAGALVGAVGNGVWEYRRDIRTRLPRESLPPAPAQASWPPRARWVGELANVALMAAVLGIVVALLGDEESAFFGALVIGKFAGTGVAALAGERQVANWERRHGLRVAFSGEDEDEQRFAVHPLSLLTRP